MRDVTTCPSILLCAVSAAIVAGCSEAPARAHEPAEAGVVLEDTLAIRAAEAVAAGRPWRATLLLEPRLRDTVTRSPEVVLIGARAAAAWGGWQRVTELLTDAPWLGTSFAGEGHELLARAALGLGRDSAAREHADVAVQRARPGRLKGARLVLLARANERLTTSDSAAAAAYLGAIVHLPEIADWLRLRAAGTTADSAARAKLYAQVTLAAAQGRIARTEAYARERARDFDGAARLYAELGAPSDALRMRILGARAARDSAALPALRGALIDVLKERAASADARDAVVLLDTYFAPLTPGEELIVARSAMKTAQLDRALAAYGKGLVADATPADRLDYASLLARLGRHRDAAKEFARITGPPALAGDAAYQQGRSLLRAGDAAAAKRTLQRVTTRFSGSDAAASALFLLADMATDALRDVEARRYFLDLAKRYPNSPLAPRARLRAAIAAFAAGNGRTAALELDTLIRRYPKHEEVNAARYWAGRAWSLAGNQKVARDRWLATMVGDSTSYYAQLASRRLDTVAWSPGTVARDTTARDSSIAAVMLRADRLDLVGMNAEARFEYEALAASATTSAARSLAIAEAFRDRRLTSRAIQLAMRAIARGAPRDARTYRLLYPVAYEDLLLEHSGKHKLDPALVAALIRQESNFEPRATSRADARGLMQVLPSVGRELARRLKFPYWSTELLYEPEVNIQLGTIHLNSVLNRYDDPIRALAAYNAGGSRVVRWATKKGSEDAELFAERIPYVETRDYVRVIQRTREWYRALYGWE